MTVKRQRPPTDKQKEAWDKLDAMTAERKNPPSVRELMLALGCSSTSIIFHRLQRGICEGRVIRVDSGSVPHFVPAWWSRMVHENMERYYGAKING
jgi:SOS-response transcriptional repressor LexA